MSSWEQAVRYHQATKHQFHRMARSPGYLDWDSQPNPFRRFEGAPMVQLALAEDEDAPSYGDLFDPGAIRARAVTFETISRLFELSLALSAWKSFKGTRWALRINPSSGNLHPTEGYLMVGPVGELHDQPGVYHYAPQAHCLERRTELSPAQWERLTDGFPRHTFFVGLTSIHWREAWKYGERAFRYCEHDVGHAMAAVCLAARAQGWTAHLLEGIGDQRIAGLLGLDREQDFADAEAEHPDLLLAVIPEHEYRATESGAGPSTLPGDTVDEIRHGAWFGKANQLSGTHVEWAIIDETASACRKPETDPPDSGTGLPGVFPEPRPSGSGRMAAADRTLIRQRQTARDGVLSAARIIRQRRSAVAMDGKTGLTSAQFYAIMDRLLPRDGHPVFAAQQTPPCVHLALFVHLVEGLAPGLYMLVRRHGALESLRAAMDDSFAWQTPPACPESLPLYLLNDGDFRAVAWRLSCDQQIAGAGAFSLGMVAEFEPRLRQFGAWFYRRLFREAGTIGQMLYLEAEAAGVRSTGIGCFYDDPVHELLGLKDEAFQSLYHFTVGGAVEDTRLTTDPPYSS